MNIGALWRKARYAAAEVLFRLGGFVEPRFEFEAAFKAIADCMDYEGTKTGAEDMRADLQARVKADAIARHDKATRN